MKKILFFLSVWLCNYAMAQQKLPVLKSTGQTIQIREGQDEMHEQYPKGATNLDIYVPKPFVKTQKITYLSDIDSITFDVVPNRKYNFIILQNNRDTTYAQINTYSHEFVSYPTYTYTGETGGGIHVIPFTIGDDSRIYLKGKINNSDSLCFLFDTGASGMVISTAALAHKASVTLDGSVLNEGTDGMETVKTSAKNTLDIHGLTWKEVPLLAIDFADSSFDAVLGWVAFQNKVVKINYESQKITIYDSLPKIDKEFNQMDCRIVDGIPYIKCKMVIGGEEVEEWFDFDSGSDGTLAISNAFASHHQIQAKIPKLGESISIGSAGIAIKNDVHLLPRLKIGNYELYNIFVAVPQKDPETPNKLGNIGNVLLKRFTTIIDFRTNRMYIRPNVLFYSSMY